MKNSMIDEAPQAPVAKLETTLAAHLGILPNTLNLTSVGGGHMAYQRSMAKLPESGATIFLKAHDPSLFTDPGKELRCREYLRKEDMAYSSLRKAGFEHIPTHAALLEESWLVMEGLSENEGWQWEAPEDPDLRAAYIKSVLASFDSLQKLAVPSEDHFFPQRILQVYMEEGWDFLTTQRVDMVRQRIEGWIDSFHVDTQEPARQLHSALPDLIQPGQELYGAARQLYLCHHDARQANIAWHPEHAPV